MGKQRIHEARPGFDPDLAGKRAECDGGGPVEGTRYAGRQDFAGTLTGDYVDHGDPPWRWYFMTDLFVKPGNYIEEGVWCESESVFLIEDRLIEDRRVEDRRVEDPSIR